jgi:hypothetical protein
MWVCALFFVLLDIYGNIMGTFVTYPRMLYIEHSLYSYEWREEIRVSLNWPLCLNSDQE